MKTNKQLMDEWQLNPLPSEGWYPSSSGKRCYWKFHWSRRILVGMNTAISGIKYRYPLCCIARYTFEAIFTPHVESGTHRGLVDERYVPCGLFHKREVA